MQVRNSQFEKSLLNKIARVANKLEQEVETELKVSFALTFSQFKVLEALSRLGEMSQRELASALDVTPAVVTRQAEVLSGRGLLVQRPNPLSKRENLLALTIKGDQAARDAAKAALQKQQAVLEDLTLQDETALGRTLEVIIKSFK